MNWNSVPGEERLLLWKNLRIDLADKPLDERLSEIAKFFSQFPIGSRSIDYYDSSNWPTPWEILFHGSFCRSSISLMMFYTLILLDIDEVVELELIEDGADIYLVPVIDCPDTEDHFVLNYHLGKVSMYSDIASEFSTKKVFREEEIKTIY